MTFQQIQDLVDLLMDKHDYPWFNTAEKDVFLNLAQNEYVKERHKHYELNEKIKQDLSLITREVRVEGPTQAFMLETLPDYMFILSVVGYFNDPKCKGSVNDKKWEHDDNATQIPLDTDSAHPLKPNRANLTDKTTDSILTDTKRSSIKPTQIDDIESAFGDPFNEPTDDEPLYVVKSDVNGHGFAQVYSESEPTLIDVIYLKFPNRFDTVNNPSGVPEFPEYAHDEIANIAVRKMLENVMDGRYNTQLNEIRDQSN